MPADAFAADESGDHLLLEQQPAIEREHLGFAILLSAQRRPGDRRSGPAATHGQ
jgi:hypothetical protein